MTQALTLPTASARPASAATSATSDSPDILFVLKHYRWLLVWGTVLGLMVATGLFFALRKWAPQYVVEQNFQVLPSMVQDPFESTVQHAEVSKDEIDRTIRRQMYMVLSDDVLQVVLQTNAFSDSIWLKKHRNLPKMELKKVLSVSPILNTDLFKISMRGADPQELKTLVTSIATTYYDALRNEEKLERSQEVTDIENSQKEMQKTVDDLNNTLDEFRRTHNDVGAISQTYQLKMTMLGGLNQELIRAENATAQAKSYQDMIKNQADNGGQIQLTPDLEYYVKNDPSLKNLENMKIQLDTDLAVNVALYGANFQQNNQLRVRIQEVQKQADKMREDLTRDAGVRMQENARNQVNQAIAAQDDLTKRRDELQHELHDIDSDLVVYRNNSVLLESKQKLLDEYTRQLTIRRLASRNDVSRVRYFGSVVVPDGSDVSWPLAKVFLPAGLLLGMALAFGLAYLLELTNTRVRTPRDITRNMQLPLLGFVPDQIDDSFVNGDLATSIRTSPASMIAESFRQIRGRLVAQSNGRPLTSLLVASASPGGGSTTVASNLANGVALNGLRVLLIDANFYRPGLKNAYPNLPAAGLGDVLAGKARAEDAIMMHSELPTLHLLGAGTIPATGAAELLETKAFKDFLAQARSRFDMVIFDAAPLNLVSDSLTLAAKLDGVIAVVRAGAISKGTVARVRDQLKQVHANLLGIVLNAAQTRGSGYFKQNYRSFYEYAATVTPVARPAVTAGHSSN